MRSSRWTPIGIGLGLLLIVFGAMTGNMISASIGVGILCVVSMLLPSQSVALILVALVTLMPFAGDFGGYEDGVRKAVSVSISDLLVLAVLPGALRLFWGNRRNILAALPRPALWYGIWSLAFILICGLSFGLNRDAISGSILAYAAGGMRVIQILCVLPFIFSVVEWTEDSLRWLWTGYLCSVFIVMETVTISYLIGAGGFATFGVHKNATGLTVATGVLIALASRWNEERDRLAPSLLSKMIVICGMPALAASSSRIAVICFLFGLLLISVRYRKVRLPILLSVVLFGSLYAATIIKPKGARGAEMTVSLSDVSVKERLTQYSQGMERFRQSPVWGDGLRSRKDIEPHNLEVLLLAETGILGLAAFGVVLASQWALLRHAVIAVRDQPAILGSVWAFVACDAALFIHAQADPFWRKGPLFLMGICIGILCSLLRERYSMSTQSEVENVSNQQNYRISSAYKKDSLVRANDGESDR